ncbi:cobaltochelatase CobT-related protein [Aliiroseovarius sp.]|uniref:cobaltochelatase CobT-related protein n=1 Tax=Aliiroseovarius sp. TaxID=1872442 RepID=UPI003BABFD5A
MISRLLKSLLTPPSTRDTLPGGYRVYTRQFDQELRAQELPKLIGSAQDALDAAERAYRTECAEWLTRAQAQWLRASAGVEVEDTLVTILIDHSGSMRGQRILLARALAELLTDTLGRLGTRTEVLGFTTVSWKGGQSRLHWLYEGRPSFPGRLCDLLHVIYRDFDAASAGLGHAATYMFHPELLKENVDGEALLWAAERLRAHPARKKVLLVVSDGAPVDDGTIASNQPNILEDHLSHTVQALSNEGITCAALGLDYDISTYYPHSLKLDSPSDLGTDLAEFLLPLLA